MADDNDENGDDEEPAVELGEGDPVDGAPLARVASRLSWPQQRSEIRRKEGDTTVRTPQGPQGIDGILDDVDVTYFERRQEFVDAVHEVVGTGPIPTGE